MAQENSIFHQLQSEGEKILSVPGLKRGHKLTLKPFIDRISNRYKDPFPVFKPSTETLRTISTRFHQVLASDGLSITEDMPEPDKKAAAELLSEETFKAELPARRFGVEITDAQNKPFGMLFEAMRAIHIPYSLEESLGKKISECSYFRIHFLTTSDAPRLSGAPSSNASKFSLNNLTLYLSVPDTLRQDGKNLQLAVLDEDAYTLKKIPPGAKPVRTEDLFDDLLSPKEYDAAGKAIMPVIVPVFYLLWVISRDPKLILSETKDYKAENRSRRDRGLRPYSSVHTILIDEEELRRRESHRPTEIADALSRTGGYKIPGLVLVDEHTRKSSGKLIAAYARCADEIVRKEATTLLQERDFENLAQLVRDFGARATQANFEQSKVFVPRLARGP